MGTRHEITADHFDAARVCRVAHNFSDHPGLTTEALRGLANRLQVKDRQHVKFIDPSARVDSRLAHETDAPDGRSVDQVFDSLDTPGTYIAIYEAQADPEFRKVVDDVISAGRRLLSSDDAEIFDSDAYVFISCAPTVTPFHIDRENNFFLQVRGTKHTSVWQPDDRGTVSEEAVEGWIVHQSLEDVKFDASRLPFAAIDGDLHAGEGVFMPPTSAHMTQTEVSGGEVSVSVGFVFYSKASRRRANIHAWNAVQRRLGITPAPVGERSMLDSVKFLLGYLSIRALSAIGKLPKPRGM